jgi:lipoprotein-anchoring transpeptidase ErfK/SrfK
MNVLWWPYGHRYPDVRRVVNGARRRDRSWAALGVVVAVLIAVAGCGSSGADAVVVTVTSTLAVDGHPDASTETTDAADGGGMSATLDVAPAVVTASPAFGTADLAPSQPVTVGVAGGALDAVSMISADGVPVAGVVSADRRTWTVGEPLRFGQTYTVTGSATVEDGQKVPISGTFSTVPDTAAVRNTVYPGDDVVVGVAAPITVYFGVEPVDKAAVAARVTLTSDPAVEGAWAWVQHIDGRWALDYRTKSYWPAGTKVHVSARLFGVVLAPGAYGAADITSDFVIGRNQVVLADVNSHQLVVQRDGATVATYPASYGRGEDTGDPNLITRSGIHVVNGMDETKLMSNPRYGYSDVPEKWAVRISNNGEFIHANPASSGAQGNSNVTHGCVNLSLADAEAYFHSAIWGDPVEVTGTSVFLGPDDGDIYIWAMSWDQWKARSTG